jgi:transposase
MAYSKDFRKKVLEIMSIESLTAYQASHRFKIDLKTVKSWQVSIDRKEHIAKSLKRKLQCSIDNLFQLK